MLRISGSGRVSVRTTAVAVHARALMGLVRHTGWPIAGLDLGLELWAALLLKQQIMRIDHIWHSLHRPVGAEK